jgi:hypothetical protein
MSHGIERRSRRDVGAYAMAQTPKTPNESDDSQAAPQTPPTDVIRDVIRGVSRRIVRIAAQRPVQPRVDQDIW